MALVISDQGVVTDVSFQGEDLARDLESNGKWIGRPWQNTVAGDSRAKIDTLLRDAMARAAPRWRHVNHPSARGQDIPILYSAVRLGDGGKVVAFGRDLRAISELQQRLVDAQQSIEREYSRLRHLEMRYRLLFQMSPDAVLVLDAATQKVTEANPAAQALFGDAAKRLIGRSLRDAFHNDSAGAVQALLATARAGGRTEDIRGRLIEGGREVMVSASLFREETASLFLVRVTPVTEDEEAEPRVKSKLLKLVEVAPDGLVIIEKDGTVVTANSAFLDMAQLATEEQARGESLERWLGRPGIDMDVLLSNLRQRGSVRLFATQIRGEYGVTADVEVSGVSVGHGGNTYFGFIIRHIGGRVTGETKAVREVPRSVEQLAELVGRVSLKELVRESTDVIERLCIEAALELSGDNRASAAEMLGLSRQSFYVKLRRYGLGDLGTDGGE